MQDFAMVIKWAFSGVIPSQGRGTPFLSDEIMNGENIKVEKTVLRNSTGITALSFNAAFFAVSYSPSSAADKNASASHISYIYLPKSRQM